MRKNSNPVLKSSISLVAMLLFISLVHVPLSFAADEAQGPAREAVNKAMKAYREGKCDDALIAANEAIKIKPDDAEAYNARGLGYYCKHQKEFFFKSIEDFDLAIKLKPDFSNAYMNRGNAKSDQGQLDGDIEDQNAALKLVPNSFRAYLNRSVAYYRLKAYDKAVADLTRALELKPDDADILMRRGNSYFWAGDYDRAMQDYDKGLQLNPNDAACYKGRARVYVKRGDFDRAMEDANRSLALQPLAGAYNVRGDVYRGKGDINSAIKDYDACIKMSPEQVNLDAYFGRGMAYKLQGDTKRAVEDIRKAVAMNPENAEFKKALAEIERDALVKKPESGPAMTFGNPGGVTVMVPDGLVAGNAAFAAVPSKIAAQLPKPAALAKILGAYDISLGNTSAFDREIMIEIPYDPATLDPNSPEGKNLWVSSWDPTKKLWSVQRAEVDTQRKRLMVRTTHLSTWVYWTLQGYKYVESSEKVMPVPKGLFPRASLPAAALVVYYNPNDTQPRTDGVPVGYQMKNFADDVLAALTEARQAYQDDGFTPLDFQVNAIITDVSDSNMDPVWGNVFLKRTSLSTLALLRHDAGHELFHVVQNQYFNVASMYLRRWWIEGTPDYAAATVWKETPTPLLDANYFDDSLYINDLAHAYQNNQFIHYLVSQWSLDFKSTWDAVVDQSGVGDNGAAAFQKYVSGATGRSFAFVWGNFVDRAMFGSHPLARAISAIISIPDAFTTDSTPVTIPGSSAKGVFIRPKISDGKPPARIKISVAGLTEGATVEIWKVKLEGLGVPNRSTGKLGHVLVEGKADSPVFELDSQNGLEAIVINPGLNERSFTITAQAVSGPLVAITPARIENAGNKIL